MDVMRGLEIGGDSYFTKPIDPQKVVFHIRSILRRVYEYDQTTKNNENSLNNKTDSINKESKKTKTAHPPL